MLFTAEQTHAICRPNYTPLSDDGTVGLRDLGEHQMNGEMTFEDFVVTDENRAAVEYAKRIAEGNGYRTLFLAGGTAVGKSHLLSAISNYVMEHFPQKKVVFVTAEQYVDDYVRSIRAKKVDEFKPKYRSADILLVDDFQFFERKEGTQEQFFSAFDELQNAGKVVVIAANRLPAGIDMEARYQSRLAGGLTCEMLLPDTAGRIEILHMWAKEMDITLDDELAALLAEYGSSDLRTMAGALIRAATWATISGQPLDAESVRPVILELKPAEHPSLEAVDQPSVHVPTIDEAHRLLRTGLRFAGLEELRAAVADNLVDLSWGLRIDNVTNEHDPENYPECEHLILDAEALLAATQQRPDKSAWLSWHTAARRLFLVQEKWAQAADTSRRLLDRFSGLDDPSAAVVQRLEGWFEADSAKSQG